MWCLCILEVSLRSVTLFANTFCQLFFHFVYSPFAVQRLLGLIRSHLLIFVYIFIALWGGSEKIFSVIYVSSILTYIENTAVFSKSFVVSGLIFRFFSVYGVKECSNYIHLHVAVWFSQYCLLKWLCFLLVYSCFVFHKLIDHRCIDLFLAIYLVSLIYISVFVPIPYCFDYCCFLIHSEVGKPDATSSVILSEGSFGYSGSSVFSYKLKFSFVLILWKNALVIWLRLHWIS